MSDAIRFLETLGRDSRLAHLSPEAYAALVANLDVEADARDALLQRDSAQLSQRLGGRTKVLFALLPADDDQQGDQQQEQEQEPSRQDEPPADA
jgi:hypothetical protein